MAGLATGLTALAATLGAFARRDDQVAAHLDDQRAQVAARAARFAELTPRVLAALAAAAVTAVPVKGAVLGGSTGDAAVWSHPDTRPMSDIDLLVPVHQRAQAAAVLVRAGCAPYSSAAHEDTFLAWGDGGAGRLDGESADHNGRVEVHPGWVEFLHGYLAHGFPLEDAAELKFGGAAMHHAELEFPVGQARLQPAAFVAHVVGHLASTVVRAEVRAVNLLDVLFLHRAGVDWPAVAAVQTAVDPRLTAPGLWLVDCLIPGIVPADLLARELARLRHPEVLESAEPAALLRDPTQRTTVRWRASFAVGGRERAAVARQLAGSAVGRVHRR
jgi:hypothetical protein